MQNPFRSGSFLIIAAVVIIQLIPIGRNHSNPPVTSEPAWDTPKTRELAKRACFDCHSNESVWPWYSNIAPISWLVQRDVDEGRRMVNFSEWSTSRQERVDEIIEVLREGEMPPPNYLLLHPGARLSSQERADLARGIQAVLNK